MTSNIQKEPGPNDDSLEQILVPEKRKREYKDFGHDEDKATRMICSFFFLCQLLYLSVLDAKVDMSTVRLHVMLHYVSNDHSRSS